MSQAQNMIFFIICFLYNGLLTLLPIRAMAPGVFDSEILGLQTFEHMMRVVRTWDSAISLLPKGGDTIWGNLDWSPEEGHSCNLAKKINEQLSSCDINCFNHSDRTKAFHVREPEKYGRMISFGKATSKLPSSQLPILSSKVL